MKTCILEDCNNDRMARGLCTKHYAYHKYHGTLDSIGLPLDYRHWLTAVNTEDRTAICSICGFTKIHSKGMDRNGIRVFRCRMKSTSNIYRFGDGDTISLEETEETRLRLTKEQDGICAICKRSDTVVGTLCLDHCHTTGKIRGLLCRDCNIGLGWFRDSPDALMAASEYLTR